jgi:gamma-glutamyltranspeptidase / glutathione hydrolase
MSDAQWINDWGPKTPVTGVKAAASTDSAIVTDTILRVMKEGGSAVDGAIAGCLVQAAVEPFMTNHTGTVTFLYYEAKTGKRYQLDSVGTFPDGLPPFKPIPAQGHGYAALPPSACIPGFMPGLKAIYQRFGTIPWARLCEDAIRWAEEGHPVSSFELAVNIFAQDFVTYLPDGRAFFLPGGYLVPVGQRFRHPEMAKTLRQVAREGPDWMITGGWADAFVARANEMGWKITKAHMTETPPRWLDPLTFRHHEYEIASLAPPQQQGVFCAFVLGVLRHLAIRDTEPGSAEHLFYLSHAMRQGLFHCGMIGDPDAADYGVEAILDDGFHRSVARIIKGLRPKVDLSRHVELTAGPGSTAMANSAAGKPTGGNSVAKQPTGSCELSVVDQDGNWVQMMNTLQSGGIPGAVVEGIPMVGSHATFTGMNGFMDAKLVKGIRPRCVIGNTMVFRDGKPIVSLGSPGNVHCTVPQVLTYLLDYGFDPYRAADAPRMLPLAEDASITVEDRVSGETIAALKSWGVTVRAVPQYDYHMGSFQMCFRDPATGRLGATADPRRCGVADGIR